MKRIILANCIMLIMTMVNGQTNVFPASGNVGIGTSNPLEQLHIQGATTAIKMNPDFNGASYIFTHNGTTFTPMIFQSQEVRFIVGSSAGVEALRILGNGSIGIGTGAPQASLEISKVYDVATNKALRLFYNNSWGNVQYANDFRFLDISSTEGGNILQVNGYGMGVGFNPPGYMSPDKLYVNGNIGVGTNTIPGGYRLAVAGKIITEEVKVKLQSSGWPDYVFNPSYKLTPLSQVEAFIKQNGHLPDVPAAQEVAEKGIEVGANQAVLLKKIEELTLHLIEMEKKIQQQEGEMKEQRLINGKQAMEINNLKSKISSKK